MFAEVAAGLGAGTAAAWPGRRPGVHFPVGGRALARALVGAPPGGDLPPPAWTTS